MVAYQKFNQFTKDMIDGVHNFGAHSFKVMLTNTAPSASNVAKSDIAEIAAGNGYPAGGLMVPVTDSTASGVAKVSGSTIVFTATGGSIGPFQYAVLYNATSVSGALIGFWDYSIPVTLGNTETLTVQFDAVNGIFTVT